MDNTTHAQDLRSALEWYGEQARLARLIHREGDAGRHALADDGGKLAKKVLALAPATDEPVADVMIGNFIAQYDEGAAGCMMEADDAQALAREFKRMQGLIYCPGVLRCAKCDFRLIKTKLTPAGAFANEEPDSCPNCNVPMWRVTWKDEAHDAYKTAESQMDRALEAERKLDHPPAAEPVALRALLDRAELAWQRFFYPAADNFSGPIGDKLPSVDLEVADCLRLVLAELGRHVVTPETDIPALATPARTDDAALAGGDATQERPYPKLLTSAEAKALLSRAEALWDDLQRNDLGGASGINRPFYILREFKQVIEEFGGRDVGLRWSKDQLDAAALKRGMGDA